MSPGAAAAVDDETITNASTLEWVLFNVCAVVVMMIDLLRSDGSRPLRVSRRLARP